MSKSRVIVLSVVQQGLSKAEVARKYGVTWRWVHTLVTRYERGGLEALEPRSRRPHTNPKTTSVETRERITTLRKKLRDAGFDAGPQSIRDRLLLEGLPSPAAGQANEQKKPGI